MKRCAKCGSTERYASGDCKQCARNRAKKYQAAHPEQTMKKKLAWAKIKRAANVRAAKAKEKANRLKYKVKRDEYAKSYYAANPGVWTAWRRNNKAKVKTAYNRWRDKNPGKARAAAQRWRLANPWKVMAQLHRRRARRRNAKGSHTGAQILGRFAYYGFLCWVCQAAPATCVDHVFALCNGGTNFAGNLRPACAHCNSAKGNWESRQARTIFEIMAWVESARVIQNRAASL